MPGNPPAATGWKERLLAELRRDKKKTAVMGVLLVVGVVVGVRAVLKTTGGAPAPVQAEAVAVPPAAAMPAVTTPVPPRAAEPALKDLRPRTRITQDIFAVNLRYFPQDSEANAGLAASPTTQAVDANVVRTAAVRARAKSLLLQSTIVSRQPKAIINGQLVGVHDTIQGFQVVEVSARSCVLVQDGVRVQLDMKDE